MRTSSGAQRTTIPATSAKTESRHRAQGRLVATGLAIAFFMLGGRRAAGEETVVAPVAGTGLYPASSWNARGDDELRLDQIFESHLPTTLEEYALRFSVHPHLGDWENKDNMRLTTSLRYGLTKNCEISLSSNLYFSHGHGNIRAFDDYGAADLQPGIKINLGQPLFPGWDAAIGADYQFPIGHPAPELTDGLRHFRPYITFSHRLEAHPDVRIFVGFKLDAVTTTSLPGEFGKNAFRQSSAGITGGWVIDRGNLHYTFEAEFDSTRLTSRTEEDITSIRPGLIWEIPALHHRQVVSNWLVGVAVTDTYGPGGNTVGASFRLRYTSDLKSRFHRTPGRPAPMDASF
jgi:hypothetical protein